MEFEHPLSVEQLSPTLTTCDVIFAGSRGIAHGRVQTTVGWRWNSRKRTCDIVSRLNRSTMNTSHPMSRCKCATYPTHRQTAFLKRLPSCCSRMASMHVSGHESVHKRRANEESRLIWSRLDPNSLRVAVGVSSEPSSRTHAIEHRSVPLLSDMTNTSCSFEIDLDAFEPLCRVRFQIWFDVTYRRSPLAQSERESPSQLSHQEKTGPTTRKNVETSGTGLQSRSREIHCDVKLSTSIRSSRMHARVVERCLDTLLRQRVRTEGRLVR